MLSGVGSCLVLSPDDLPHLPQELDPPSLPAPVGLGLKLIYTTLTIHVLYVYMYRYMYNHV